MGELGKRLQEARQAKEITFEQISAETKIKARFIEAIETEDFAAFPSVPMLRGFIRNYALYLELDPADVLAHYQQNGLGEAKKWGRVKKKPPFVDLAVVRPRSRFNADMFITLLIITALLGSAAFFAYTQFLEPAQLQLLSLPATAEAQPSTGNRAAVVLPTPTPLPTDTPTPSPTPSPQYYTGVAVELKVHERSWVQILVDDVKTFEGILEAGDRPNWVGENKVAIRAGNGGGVEVFINGQNMGFMGEQGQVIDQVWEKVNEIPDAAPTATVTPLPAATTDTN